MTILKIKLEISIIFVLALFMMAFLQNSFYAVLTAASVLAHELAHLTVSKIFGYTPEKISLGIFGGTLHLKESFLKPRHELLIHLSGPAFSLLVASILYFFSQYTQNKLMEDLLMANLVIGIFNLLPFYPLDGGKVMRLYMAFFLGYGRAIRVSRFFSVIFCFFLFLLGVFLVQYNELNALLCALAINLLIITKRENTFFLFKTVKIMENGSGKSPTDKMVVCRVSDRAYKLVERYRPSENRIFTVVNSRGNYRGQLSELELLEGIYDCGIYADFGKILSEKGKKNELRKKHRGTENENRLEFSEGGKTGALHRRRAKFEGRTGAS